MGDRFHKAARDGSSNQGLRLLKEATSRDLNRVDKEGMTPTLIAAECGHLEAMKICVGRGGKANCCNGLGQTALHLATNKGHLHMVNFLSKYYEDNFIKIIFMLDNVGMTAKQIAADKNDLKTVNLLDRCEAVFMKNTSSVDKYKNKAQKDMAKNQKKFAEARAKQNRQMEKEGSKKTNSSNRTYSTDQRRTIALKDEDGDHRKKSFFATLGKRMGTVKRKQLLEGLDFTEGNGADGFNDGTMTISAGNKNVLFKGATNKTASADGTHGRTDIRDIFDHGMDTDDPYHNDLGHVISTTGLFGGGGEFGKRMFFKQNTALTDQMEQIESENKYATSFLKTDEPEPEQLDSDEELIVSDDDDDFMTDPLQAFLAALNLTEYWPLFKNEEMDLEAVMMATDQDLMQMGLSKGPRIKIIRSMEARRQQMEAKESNYDTAF